MNELFIYLLKAAFINAIILAFYYFSLRKTNNFRLMRGVLLSAMVLPLLLPLIPFEELFATGGKAILNPIVINIPLEIAGNIQADTDNLLSLPDIPILLYYLISLVFLSGMVISVISIFKKRLNSQKHPTVFGDVLLEPNIHSPFSFFKWVFFSHRYLEHPQLNLLLQHEFTHVKEKHSIDRIISSLFRTVLWFSPFAHITSNLLTDVHEYQADDSVIREHSTRSEYSDLILSFYLTSETTRGISNNFSFHVKKRILMINKFSTARINLTRVMTGLCLSIVFITLTAMVKTSNPIVLVTVQDVTQLQLTPGDTVPPAPDITTWVKEGDKKSPAGLSGESVISFWVESDGIVKEYQVSKSAGEVLDKWAIDFIKKINDWRPASINGKPVRYRVNIPVEFTSDGNASVKLLKGGAIFTGDITKLDQKSEEDRTPLYPGGDEARINYISENVVYPEDAIKSGTEGTVYVQFIITEKGKVTQVKILKGVSVSIDKVALEIVSKMPDWKPAIKNGKPIAYELTMPIAFKLDKSIKDSVPQKAYPDDSYSKSSSIPQKKEESHVFTLVEESPKFPGGDEARTKYLSSNVIYPQEARAKGIEGTVYMTFIIEEDGSVTDVKVLRGVNELIDKAALDAVSGMPKWEPGKQKGKPVAVQFNMPIKFSLEKNKKNEENKVIEDETQKGKTNPFEKVK